MALHEYRCASSRGECVALQDRGGGGGGGGGGALGPGQAVVGAGLQWRYGARDRGGNRGGLGQLGLAAWIQVGQVGVGQEAGAQGGGGRGGHRGGVGRGGGCPRPIPQVSHPLQGLGIGGVIEGGHGHRVVRGAKRAGGLAAPIDHGGHPVAHLAHLQVTGGALCGGVEGVVAIEGAARGPQVTGIGGCSLRVRVTACAGPELVDQV